ncbi:DUF397 domain-containing protein [Kribbella sp. NPDC056861]|uniref:DUF397 domain-containing protein n=1 Tax=Kribbella sp. NPDC056861 TaxID=3154857 RepID=UPI003427BA66
MNDLSGAVWRKSSRSNNSNNCVEIALLPDGGAAVRDTKDHGAGHTLRYTAGEWVAFLEGVKAGEFDRPTS